MNETEHDRLRDDLAAFALGVLESGEAAELERHLAGCDECRAELDWLRPAVQLLPESVERMEPPPELRARLMEQVREEASRSPSRRGFHNLRSRRAGRRFAWQPLAGLAAAALVAVAIGAFALGGGSGGEETTTVFAGRSPGVTAQMVSEDSSGTLRLANLRRLPPDEVLQAWVQRGERVVSAKTLFVPNPDGTATATIDDMEGVSVVMVTAEPRGGSVQPTSEPIVSIAIPQ